MGKYKIEKIDAPPELGRSQYAEIYEAIQSMDVGDWYAIHDVPAGKTDSIRVNVGRWADSRGMQVSIRVNRNESNATHRTVYIERKA